MQSSVTVLVPGSRPTKDKHDLKTQNLFRRVITKAESRGMKVNKGKTKVLCVSDANTYDAACHIFDSNGGKISSGSHMKILGFHMDNRPSCHSHVAALQARMTETMWISRHLKHNGFTEEELAIVYRIVILPVLDYCCVVYHPMITDEQDQQIERLQAKALKNIYG